MRLKPSLCPPWDPGAPQDQLDTAIFQYKQLVDQQPTHYEALSHLLGLLKRVGRLQEAQPHLAAAAASVGTHGGSWALQLLQHDVVRALHHASTYC